MERNDLDPNGFGKRRYAGTWLFKPPRSTIRGTITAYAAISGTGTSASLNDQQRAIQVLGKTDRRRLPDRHRIRSAKSNLDAQLVR